MSPARPQASGREVVRAPEGAGFAQALDHGSHAKLRHPDGRVVIVPLHNPVTATSPSQLCRARAAAAAGLTLSER